uniref:HEPN_Swt1 domain-containing protein n=1 Tax=Meloidogyne hapla TaxID=6305 RepID=A0A1I8BQX1_MELHA
MTLNIDRGDKEPQKQKEFLEKLIHVLPDRYQNIVCEDKVNSKEHEDKDKLNKIDERVNFILDVVKYFRCECKFAKQIDNKLESIKRFFISFKFGFKNLDDVKKQTEGAYIKVEEFLFNKLRDEVNKPLRKDDAFSTAKMEQIKEVLGLRLNLDKYLNRIGKGLENFEKRFENLIKKLNKENPIREMVLNISKDAKGKDKKLNLNALDKVVNEESILYTEQYKKKIEYLFENGKMLQEAKEDEVDRSLIKLFKGNVHLLVGYCLVQQFIIMFNEEGKPKMRVFKATESFMAEHSAMLGNVLVDQVDEEGFRLADDSFMLIDMKMMPGLALEGNEWAQLYDGALERFNEHKFTLTETHYLLDVMLGLMHEDGFDINHKKLVEKFNDLHINRELSEELKLLSTHPYNKILSSSINQKLPKIEADFKLRKNIQDCSLAVYLLKFTLTQLDRAEKTPGDQKKFLMILRRKLIHGAGTIKIENEEMDKKATFIKKVKDNFVNFCNKDKIYKEIKFKNHLIVKELTILDHPFINVLDYLGSKNHGKKLEDELKKKKNTVRILDPFAKVFRWKLNSNNFLDEVYEAVNRFDKALNFLSDLLANNEFFIETFTPIEKLGGNLEQIKQIVEESKKANISRILQKLAFSIKNWKKLQKQQKIDEGPSVTNNPLNKKGVLSILYCLANRFINLFNEDGKVDMEDMMKNQTNINVLEYASKLKKVMGNYRLNKLAKHLLNKKHQKHITELDQLRFAYGEFADNFNYVVLTEGSLKISNLDGSLKKEEYVEKMLSQLIRYYDELGNVLEEDLDEDFLAKMKEEFANVVFQKSKILVLNWQSILKEELNSETIVSDNTNVPSHTANDNENGHSAVNSTKDSEHETTLEDLFSGLGLHFVGYCFAQRFLQAFNENGTVKMSSFIEDDAEQDYGLKFHDMMDRKILNNEFYKTIKEKIKEKLDDKCISLENEERLSCEALLQEMLQKWHGYCSMDTDNLEFERFDELDLIK